MAWHLCPVTEDFYMLGGGGGAEPNLPWGDDDEYYSRATQATVEQKQAIGCIVHEGTELCPPRDHNRCSRALS